MQILSSGPIVKEGFHLASSLQVSPWVLGLMKLVKSFQLFQLGVFHIFFCSDKFEPCNWYDMKWANIPFSLMFLFMFYLPPGSCCIDETVIVIHTCFAQGIDLMGFKCAVSFISTCVLNNLGIDTVGYTLSGLLSPSGSCSCVRFLFNNFLSPPHTSEKSWFALHMRSKVGTLGGQDCDWSWVDNNGLQSIKYNSICIWCRLFTTKRL